MIDYSALERQLKQANTFGELKQALVMVLKTVGLQTFSFTYYGFGMHAKAQLKYHVSSNNLRQWHEHYLEEGYQSIDSTNQTVSNMTVPVIWEIHEQLKNARTKKEKKMREDSLAFGAEKGLVIPVHGPGGDFAILMVEKLRQETASIDWNVLRYELIPVAHLYYDRMRSLLLRNMESKKESVLSRREQQCLKLLAENYSVAELAKALKITERTVNFHIQNILHKLGVKNKYQAVTKALEQGLLG